MYQYDNYDQRLLEQRCQEFRTQVQRRIDGKLSEEEFKPIRLMNGLYLQLHAYMLRAAIPYGVLSAKQLRMFAFIADTYDRGYGHFTTRQNIQFNWPRLVDTPDILDYLSQVQLHAIQTSGNCIRNITTDPYAGVAADEAVDPRPICELLRQWSTLHPEFAYLPRKFKFAITGAANDRAAIKVHDVGLQLKKSPTGDTQIDLWVGGGQGRTPKIAQLFKSDLSIVDLLPYLEALMRVYNRHGRRDNKYKARIKILLTDTGLQVLQDKVEDEYKTIDRTEFPDIEKTLTDISSRFSQPEYKRVSLDNDTENRGHIDHSLTESANGAFQEWIRHNVKTHVQSGYAIVVISLKPAGGIPGDATAAQMVAIADLAERYSANEIRVTHRQNLVLPYVEKSDLYSVWQALRLESLAEANHDLPSDIIACPGLDYCALATARSIPLAQDLSAQLRVKEQSQNIGQLSINISGCINACGHHHVASIGILGLDRAGTENYQITLGGRNGNDASIGERMGQGLPAEEVAPAIERVIDLYLDNRQGVEKFSDTYDRLGKDRFKDVLYEEDAQDAAV